MFPKSLFVLTVLFVGQVHPGWFPWSGGGEDEQNLNWVLDKILSTVSGELIAEHADEIEIAVPVNTSQTIKLLFFNIDMSAIAYSNGVLKNLSSVVRISDADIQQETDSGKLKNIILRGELKLKNLVLEYPSIFVKVSSYFTYNGSASVECSDNAFNVAVEIDKDGSSCSARLEPTKTSIKELSGCSVKLEKGGFLNFLKQLIFSYAFRTMDGQVLSKSNSELPNILSPIIAKHDICRFLNPSLVQ